MFGSYTFVLPYSLKSYLLGIVSFLGQAPYLNYFREFKGEVKGFLESAVSWVPSAKNSPHAKVDFGETCSEHFQHPSAHQIAFQPENIYCSIRKGHSFVHFSQLVFSKVGISRGISLKGRASWSKSNNSVTRYLPSLWNSLVKPLVGGVVLTPLRVCLSLLSAA